MRNSDRRILLTGATGYIGGRMLSLLERQGYSLRCLTRRPAALKAHQSPHVQVVEGDLLQADSLTRMFDGIDTAFYFVHSMGTASDFEEDDRRAAVNFVAAANQAKIRRIIYLGGLGCREEQLSKHLRSRQETGEILRTAHAEVIELRASIIIGSGSLSFEMIRSLVERLPVMICPKWVGTMAQPIAVEDMLLVLVESIDVAIDQRSTVVEIGGPDRVSYGDIMQEYARQRGLRRLMIPVPVLTPYLSSLWLGFVTPIYARIGRKLIASLKNPTLVNDPTPARRMFSVKPRSLAQAIDRSLKNEDQEFATTRWSDAFSSGSRPKNWGGVRFGSRLVDSRQVTVGLTAQEAFRAVQRIGGDTGWYCANHLWQVRGFLDLLVGGVGIRRGRRHPEHLQEGDALDFWRVEEFVPGRLLRLQAEMKVPGRAWLEFEVNEVDKCTCSIRQTALFDPVGLLGRAYWYGLYPLHQIVFRGMLHGLIHHAKGPAPARRTMRWDRHAISRSLQRECSD